MTLNTIITGTQNWFNEHPYFKKAIVGISGGKDSSVVAAILCKAIGKDKVVGVLMPNGVQKDIADSEQLVNFLGIQKVVANIGSTYSRLCDEISYALDIEIENLSSKVKTNIPPRLRMTTLYAIAAQLNGCVIGTSNLSESLVGWGTLWGDTVADFNPIKNLLCEEVINLGKKLGLPKNLINKAPSDGLTGKTDEENFGFTYEDLSKAYKHWYNLEVMGMNVPEYPVDMDAELYYKIINQVQKFQFKRNLIGNVPTIEKL